jgi:cytosolic nonspecific dipeptidase
MYIERLREAVAIKSISSEAAMRPECIRMMHWTKAWMDKLGADTTTLHDIGMQTMHDGSKLPLPPILTAVFGTDPSKKTVAIYGHLDVQPASKSDGWATEPFELTVDDKGRMYGRGSTDDKGPVLGWLWAIEAYRALNKPLPVNIKFLLEGMEESGSEGLEEFVGAQSADNGGFLGGVDFTCISDNYWLGKNKPCITHGLRGICYFFVEIACSVKDLHSGVYGGPVAEAMQDMVKLLATLNDNDGRIAIPGIYDAVRKVTPEEDESYKAIDFDPEVFRAEVGASALRFSDKESVLKARWRFPTCSIHGIEGAWAGPGAKTVIPAKVTGKLSLRIVPDMTPEEVEAKVTAHINAEFAKLKSPNTLKVTMLHGAKAWISDVNSTNYVAARKAIETVFGQTPDITREGGSIPLTLWIEAATKNSVLLLPIGACDDSAHSANEKLDVRNYMQGIKVLGAYLEELVKA